jgi:hypothetical protein
MPRNRENAYDRYRRNYGIQKDCLRKKTAYFIENHESSVIIGVNRTGEDIPAVLVFTDKEGADEILLYVSAEDDFKLLDYFTWNSINFFAYERVEVVKEVDYVKYKALQCNVLVNDSFWAYFRSTMRGARDDTLSGRTEVSTLIPLLIAPKNDQLTIGGKITFNDQAWDIEDGDIFSLTGLGYYYLSRGINARDDEEWEPEEEIPSNLRYVNQEIVLATENGYYVADGKVKLVNRTLNQVVILPLEAGTLNVTTLKQGSSVLNTFVIKENV